jgi:hypothetical protein
MKIGQVGTELFHADGRTDGDDEAKSNFSRTLRKRRPMITRQLTNNQLNSFEQERASIKNK